MIATPGKKLRTKAYLYHLDKCGEILGARLNTIHNLRYYQRLMAEIRAKRNRTKNDLMICSRNFMLMWANLFRHYN